MNNQEILSRNNHLREQIISLAAVIEACEMAAQVNAEHPRPSFDAWGILTQLKFSITEILCVHESLGELLVKSA